MLKVRLTYTRPTKCAVFTMFVALVVVCAVYLWTGAVDAATLRDGREQSRRVRRRHESTSSFCGRSRFTERVRATMVESTMKFLKVHNKQLEGGVVVVGVQQGGESVIRSEGGACQRSGGGETLESSPRHKNADLMLQSVLSNGRSVACANASHLLPLSVRNQHLTRQEQIRQRSLQLSPTAPSTSEEGSGSGVSSPLLEDGVHCLTPLGRYLLHLRPNVSSPKTPPPIHLPTPSSLPSLPSAVSAAVAATLSGVVSLGSNEGGGGHDDDGEDGMGGNNVPVQVEMALCGGLVVGDQSDRGNAVAAMMAGDGRYLWGGGGGGSGGDGRGGTISLNKALLVQMLAVEVRGWLRALFPERLAHVPPSPVLPPQEPPSSSSSSTSSSSSPIDLYVQSMDFKINRTQTLEEEEAAHWVSTTEYISVAQHQQHVRRDLRAKWIKGGWGGRLKALNDDQQHHHGGQSPSYLAAVVAPLEAQFLMQLPSSSSPNGDFLENNTPTTIPYIHDGYIHTNKDHNHLSIIPVLPPSLNTKPPRTGDTGVYQGTPFTVLSDAFPRALRLDDVLTEEHRAQYIEHATERIQRSKVVDQAKGEAVNTVRTSFGMFVSDRSIPADIRFRSVASKVTGLPEENIEATQILRYTAGQYYRPHPDYFGRGSPILKRGGERVATMLAWLNDVPEGGETKFPNSKDPSTGKPILVEPQAGSAILFYDVQPSGATDVGSIHEAIPPIGGDKWVAVLWIREHLFT